MLRLLSSLRQAAPAAVLLLPLAAQAAGFGGAHALSRLGEPLRIEVDVSGVSENETPASCFAVQAGVPSAGRVVPIRDPRVELARRPEGLRLVVRTELPVSEPLLHVQVRLACGFQLTKSYDVLLPLDLEMPAPLQAPVAPVASPPRPTTATAPAAAVPRAAQPSRTTRQPRTANPAPGVDKAPAGGVLPPVVAAAPVTPPVTLTDSRQQAIVAAAGELAAARDEAERAAIVTRLQQALLPAVAAPTPAAPAATAPLAAAPLPADPGPAAAIPAGAAPEPAPHPRVVESSDGIPTWLLVAVGLALGAGVWWRRRTSAGDAAPARGALTAKAAGSPPPPVAAAGPATIAPAPEAGGAANIFRQPTAAAPEIPPESGEPTTTSPLYERLTVRTTHPDFDPDMPMPQVETFEEEAEVVELAELMLQFGRVSGAADALREYLDDKPKAALLPWLRLLDIYRQANQRAEFDEAARHMNKYFNVQVVAWEQANANAEVASQPHVLDGYPHVLMRITEVWGTASCVDYLNELLRDNRDGTRAGFPAEVAREMLFLIAVLKEMLVMGATPAGSQGVVA